MTPERWKRISGVFAEALALDPDARPAFLEVACREHPEDLSLIGQLLSRDLAQPHLLEGHELLAPLQAPTPPGTLVGWRLGAYEVIAEIGRGGMGVVYLATDTRLGRLVALKALPVALAGDPARRERLRHEARAAAALSHPNIAAIHALEETDDAVYLVSEFVRGRSLRQALDGSPLPAPEAMAVLRGVAEALAAAHAAGIVHRDLKPENVLLTESGGVKLVDFGLARFLRPPGDDQTRSQLTRSGMVLGTPGYMAPEQVRGEPADARADVFAWGALAFEVVTGAPAFGARAATAALARILEAEVDLSPVRARGFHVLAPVIDRCLQKAPSARYPSASAIVWELTVGDRPATHPPDRDAGPGRDAAPGPLRWWRIHQASVAVTCAVALWPVWTVRTLGPWARAVFFVALAAAVLVVSLRLNLWFLSTFHLRALAEQRRRWRRLGLAADVVFSLALGAAAWVASSGSMALAALLVTMGLALLVAALVIEPATAREAFRDDDA